MAIQNINIIKFNNKFHINKSQQNTNKNNATSNTFVNDLRFLPYSYPVSFGNRQKNNNNISFDESIKKYFRFTPDAEQILAAQKLYKGSDTLVVAPTGTGKTLIAEYIINKNLNDNKKTFYTTPLKALSNEKYTDFCKLYGKENVGLLTGDIKINGSAPIVVMTTEIYRNMLMGESQEDVETRFNNVNTVIYDEFHYMNDSDRGETWETSVMYTPAHVQQLPLSATIKNGDILTNWFNRLLSVKQSNRLAEFVDVSPQERFVPLKYYIYNPSSMENKLVPLVTQQYNLEELQKSLKKDNNKLTTRQKEILSDISQKANANAEIEEGLKFLIANIPLKGNLQEIQNLLMTIGYSNVEAERASLILTDKQSQKLNNQLKNINTTSSNNAKVSHSYPKLLKIVSPDTLKNLLLTGKLKHDEARALMQFSRLCGGNTSINDGLKKILKLLNNKDMLVKDFEKKLKAYNLHEKHIVALSKLLMTTKNPDPQAEELALIKELDKQDKLPAIFFKFSKKQCDNLLKDYLKTGENLLNDEEKEKASEIINKHIDKGGFLGTNFNPINLLSGAAVHHAGKMPAYKALIEELAQNKLLKVVFATSTLGAGINVPAKTVVFTQLTRYNGNQAKTPDEKFVPLSIAEFQQMAGRAGRRGKDFVGNVIVMPDKKIGIKEVFHLATSAPDEIKSNFKPTYSLITHFISQDGSAEKLGEAVERSFLQDSLKSSNIKPYKIFDKMKKEFASMAKVVTSPELECFESINGKLIPTIKGNVVAKARGVNGLLFAEILFNGGLEHLTPQEMATIACTLTPPDERDKADLQTFSEMTLNTLLCLNSLYNKINQIEYKEKVNSNAFCLNLADAQNISKWASIDAEDTRFAWENLVNELSKENPNFTEGDFLKSINSTVDILEQIKETSRSILDETTDKSNKTAQKMSKINKIANEALSLLKRDPIEFDL